MPTVAERVSDTDARVWFNALEIAQALRKPPTTVYSALSNFLRYSRKVGRERRYPWPIAFELCRAYAVPLDEFSTLASAFVEQRARDRDADPRDLIALYQHVLARWFDVGLGERRVTSEMTRRLYTPVRPRDPAVVDAARAFEATTTGPMQFVRGPSRIPADAWRRAESESP